MSPDTLEDAVAIAIETAFWDGDTFAKDRCRASTDEQRKTWMACAVKAIEAARTFKSRKEAV